MVACSCCFNPGDDKKTKTALFSFFRPCAKYNSVRVAYLLDGQMIAQVGVSVGVAVGFGCFWHSCWRCDSVFVVVAGVVVVVFLFL